MFGALVPTAPAAAQDCNVTAVTSDRSISGSARLQAGTNQEGCSGLTVEVGARISNAVGMTCSKTMSGSLCRDSTSSGNAVVTVTSQGCGVWTGISHHHIVISGSSYPIATDLETSLNANCPPIECPPGWQPDGNGGCYEPSPILIATKKGARYELTSPEAGVTFDIDGDGAVEQVAWTAPNSQVAFLALDRDGNGLITSGKELFGNNTIPGATNGFEALSRMSMETNGGIMRGSVSADDPLFARLVLWVDANHNGFSEPAELRPASEFLSDIGLGYNVTNRKDRHGNLFRFHGWAHVRTAAGRNKARGKKEEDERKIPIWDAYLKVAPPR